MFFSINVYGIIYTILYLSAFIASYFVIISTNMEKLFKQGHIIAIRLGQILLALALAYLVTKGLMLLVENTQFPNK